MDQVGKNTPYLGFYKEYFYSVTFKLFFIKLYINGVAQSHYNNRVICCHTQVNQCYTCNIHSYVYTYIGIHMCITITYIYVLYSYTVMHIASILRETHVLIFVANAFMLAIMQPIYFV